MVEAARSLQGLIEKQKNFEFRVIYGAGNYMLAVPYSKFRVDNARWYLWSKEWHQDYVRKFKNYCPTLADFYPNAGRKPGYST